MIETRASHDSCGEAFERQAKSCEDWEATWECCFSKIEDHNVPLLKAACTGILSKSQVSWLHFAETVL